MLNGKELMLGDYVSIDKCNSSPVVGTIKEIHTYGEEMHISIDGSVYQVCSDKDISALFLSEAFFLENGFEVLRAFEALHINENYSWLCNGDVKVVVKLYKGDCFRCEVNGIEIEYVHEFQHLLRLINLSDYANNLKI